MTTEFENKECKITSWIGVGPVPKNPTVYKMNPMLEDCKKFKLLHGSKNPSDEWAKGNRHKWDKTKHHHGNWGCPTGKVNGIIGFDPDHYKWGPDHPFYTVLAGRSWEQYVKDVDTLTVGTPNGGHHFYFKYNKLPQINSNLEIDIKGDGGYLVRPGSKVLKKDGVTMGAYTVIHDTAVKEMPKDLYDWLWLNLNYKHNKRGGGGTGKNCKKGKELVHAESLYACDLTDGETLEMLNRLPESFITKHDDWLKTATAMKQMGKTDLFIRFCLDHPKTNCKKKGDVYYNKNVELINGITQHNTLDMVFALQMEMMKGDLNGVKTMQGYTKYKPTLRGKYKVPPTEIHAEKLGYKLELKENRDYVIKSDTGTGKTTIAKEYVKQTGKKLISIVSRISLGDAQCTAFNEHGIDVRN